MLRRWKIWLSLVILAGGLFALPAVHWRVIGWVRGEAFYQGRPTSYWKMECSQWYYWPHPNIMAPYTNPFTNESLKTAQYWIRRIPEEELRLAMITGIQISDAYSSNIIFGDPEALPVLIELLQEEDENIRHFAICGLTEVGTKARDAIPLLRTMLENEGTKDQKDRKFEWDLHRALKWIDPTGPEPAPWKN